MVRTVSARFRHDADPIKGSRFIATVVPASTEEVARSALAEVAAEWPDASHHCWAWRLAAPVIERAGDDGEPSGSAGRPILASITGRDLVDTAVIVTRWFGGTKLGVGGLVRAYGGTAAAALDLASTTEWVALTTIAFEHGHGETAAIDRALAEIGIADDAVETEWGAAIGRTVTLPVASAEALWAALADATRGRISPD